MKHFEYILIFLLFGSSLAALFLHYRRLRYEQFCKLAVKALLDKVSRIDSRFFCTYAVQEIVKLLLKSGEKKVLMQLTEGKTRAVRQFLQRKRQPLLVLLLDALANPQKTQPRLAAFVKTDPHNLPALAALTDLYFLNGHPAAARFCLDHLPSRSGNAYVRGLQAYYQAVFAAKEGDLLSASQFCSLAIDAFRRSRAFFEEGRARLFMGTIYRMTAVTDTARFMYDAAAEVYRILGFPTGIAEALGNLGMLMVLEERFDEAAAYFEQALAINRRHKLLREEAEIYNQQALLALLQKEYKKAGQLLSLALKEHQKLQNPAGQAFSHELQAHLFLQTQKWQKAAIAAAAAQKLYCGSPNKSAYLESHYLEAEALFRAGEEEKAEKILRRTIAIGRKNATSFHLANAYHLLGLIYMRRKDYLRAKGLFSQSLEQEQKNDRLYGIAVDYANISLANLNCGRAEEARKTLETARDYAKASADEVLLAAIEDLIKQNFGRQ